VALKCDCIFDDCTSGALFAKVLSVSCIRLHICFIKKTPHPACPWLRQLQLPFQASHRTRCSTHAKFTATHYFRVHSTKRLQMHVGIRSGPHAASSRQHTNMIPCMGHSSCGIGQQHRLDYTAASTAMHVQNYITDKHLTTPAMGACSSEGKDTCMAPTCSAGFLQKPSTPCRPASSWRLYDTVIPST
jgi:hypothetical protein